MFKNTFKRIFPMFLGLATLAPLPSLAEELVLEEVVVTAVRRDTNLMETPLAVSAVDAETLAREGVNNILNVGALVPNMQIGLSPSDSGVSIAIRNSAFMTSPTPG